jgi:glycosyltransferase involved in cell wall biosynthesis
VFVNPVDGNIGVQSKLLGAMAAGKPAVVTPDTAAGIDFAGEPPFLIAATSDEFAQAVVRLLQDDALAARMGARALQVIEQSYRPDEQLWRIDQALSGQAGDEPARRRPGESAALVGAATGVSA